MVATESVNLATTSAQIIINLPDLTTGWTISDYAGWFAAIGTVLLFLLEWWKWWVNKPLLKISLRFDQEIFTVSPGVLKKESGKNKTYWSVKLINVRKIDVVIEQITFKYHEPRKFRFAQLDRSKEGKFVKFNLSGHDSRSFTIDYDLIHPKDVELVIVESARGDTFTKTVKL